MTTVIIVICAYLIGAIPSGVVLTRLAGAEDVRSAGSGNIGATNVYRVAGKRLGILTLIMDMLKGLLPLLALSAWWRCGDATVALAALALFVGHCYPVYLRFKGGKGVATALGIFLVLVPWAVLVAVAVFAAVVWKWRYVSAGSIAAALVIALLVLGSGATVAVKLATLAIAAGAIYRHKENIRRLRDGSENRFK